MYIFIACSKNNLFFVLKSIFLSGDFARRWRRRRFSNGDDRAQRRRRWRRRRRRFQR